MKKFIGTKIVSAEPADATENDKRGAYLVGDPGYRVVYEDGYASWSPKGVFEAAYRETSRMTFGLAVEALKKGFKVARAGWNGKGMWLGLVRSGKYEVYDSNIKPPYTGALEDIMLPWIGMKTADNKFIPWLASQTDVLADDWATVD